MVLESHSHRQCAGEIAMLLVSATALLLIAVSTAIHYAALRGLYSWPTGFRIPSRTKVLVVIFGALIAHTLEITVYGHIFYVMVTDLGAGRLAASHSLSLTGCMYFSAETYTSLGFGDVTPDGAVRLLVGVEALNGLLLIGWSASFLCLSMERFWASPNHRLMSWRL
jgi:hypothetical protein